MKDRRCYPQKNFLQDYLRAQCGLPKERCPLNARVAGCVELADVVIEKVIYNSEPFSSVPAHLYLPKRLSAPAPAMVMANGHGGSKSSFFNQYAGQMYAKAGLVVLTVDPAGEEERDPDGRIGTRDHDRVAEEAQRLDRPVQGQMAWDLMRGIDYLETRSEIVDHTRIGVAGHSLGGMVSALLAALDERIRLALPTAMYFHHSEIPLWSNCMCAIGMYFRIMSRVRYAQLLAMAAPRCATLLMVGDDDKCLGGAAVYRKGHQETFKEAKNLYLQAGAPDKFDRQVYEGVAHRPYFLCREALLWIERHFGLPHWSREDVLALPTKRMADWAWDNGVIFETYYGREENYAGMLVPDVGVRYFPPYRLACLSREERRSPDFSIDHWLTCVAELRRDALLAEEEIENGA